jgi:hypothetical protein
MKFFENWNLPKKMKKNPLLYAENACKVSFVSFFTYFVSTCGSRDRVFLLISYVSRIKILKIKKKY